MSVSIFIPPVSFSTTIIAWKEIELLNYFRAIILLIACAFLPGACLFNIIFPNSSLFERFDTDPFIVKISIYPLLSFSIIGISVLLLDFIGLSSRDLFILILFLLILVLFILDFISQKLRKHKETIFSKSIIRTSISKSSLLIITVAIGVSLISLGIFISTKYLISGDSWTGINPAIFIGSPDLNPVDHGMQYNYPIFWGYISYGISALSGIPLININALLGPFCYLHVTITYLLMKAILYNFKAKYVVLSTLLVSIFSGIWFISPYNEGDAIVNSIFLNIGTLTYLGELSYIYKSFSLNIAFLTISLFLIVSRKNSHNSSKRFKNLENYKLVILTAFLLLISYMTYMLPLAIILILLLIYVIISQNKREKIKLFFVFIIFLFAFFYFFDIPIESFNNYLFNNKFNNFLIWFSFVKKASNGNPSTIPNTSYLFFGTIILFVIIIFFIVAFYDKFLVKMSLNKRKFYSKDHETHFFKKSGSVMKRIILKFIFVIFLALFSLSLFLELFNLFFRQYIFKYIYIEQNYWFYFIFVYLEKIFLYFGFLGILGIYLSYYCYKKDKKLFYILLSWLIFILFYSSFSFFNSIVFDNVPSIPPQEIENAQITYMNYWFSRNWFYIVPILCIFSSIGIIDLIKKIKSKSSVILRYKNSLLFIKLSLLSIIIIFSFSSVITTSMYWGRTNSEHTIKDEQAQVIGWVSENIPNGTLLLIEKDYNIYHGIMTMANLLYYDTKYVIWPFKDIEFNMRIIRSRNFEYAILYNGTHPNVHTRVSDFIDNHLLIYYFTELLYQYENLMVLKKNIT